VRADAPLLPRAELDSYRKTGDPQNPPAAASDPQDEVNVQFEPPGNIAVYQFVNQQGTLVLQVPAQPVLNLARDISQELAEEAATRESATTEGGKDNGR
jgi:hypothetical protein